LHVTNSSSGLSGGLIASLLGSCMILAPLPVLAAPPAERQAPSEDQAPIDTEARAMQAYNDGKAAYDAGKYEEALELFLDAQSLYPSPVFHYNVALCQEALGNLEQAVISYEAYLRSYKNAFGEEPEDQVNTANKIERLNKQVELEKAEADKPAPVGPTGPTGPTVIAPAPAQDDGPANPGRGMIITGGVLTGLGLGAAVIGGAAYGVISTNISAQLDDVYLAGNPERVTLEEARALDKDGRLAELNQILLLSLGGAIAVVGVALLATGIKKRNRASYASASVVPFAGPSSAGLVLHGRF
jgi:tetratricopeptide (TPR) repeat protein